MSNPISFSLQIFGDVGRTAVLGAAANENSDHRARSKDERDDQILFILKMPQQGSVEVLDLTSKPFGNAQRATVAARYFTGKRSNKLTACGVEAMDRAVDHLVVIVENVETLLQRWRSGGEGGEIIVILNTMVP